ncbi:MAG TPA: ATP-binding protein [Pyrinomonadaceae bacterium]|jgi:two-component system phosphate regulon sensor histidine kinase PhoR
MSVRVKFLLFLTSAVAAGLLVSSVWNLRTRLAILFALVAGALVGMLFSDWREELKEAAVVVPDRAEERKREGARREIRAAVLLEVMMSGMREGVLVVDAETRVVTSNPAAREIFGPTGGALVGRRLSDLTRNPAIHSAFNASLKEYEQSKTKIETEGPGGPIYDLSVVPLSLDTPGSRGAMGVFFNITRLERLERVRQEFLSNVSHELRTPLTAIIAFVETLEDGALDDSASSRRFLSIIRRNAERMHSLINDILELSAIEAGTVKVEVSETQLRALVNDVLTAVARHAEERGVALVNEVAPGAVVLADAGRLEQMLTNLVDNAIKFDRKGGRVTVSHERGTRDRITVADTGEGITPEHVKRIFERFYRVDRARSRELGGTGLGLAIVKHLARAHGGEVGVNSTPGEGSTFYIELPVLEVKAIEESHAVSEEAEQERIIHAVESN